MFALGDFWLETMVIIKILTHPCFLRYFDWFSWGWSKIFFEDFQNRQFSKISMIGPWVSWIDWCKAHWCGSTYMVVRLSNTMHFFVFLGCFWAYVGRPHYHIGWATSMSFVSINPNNPRTDPWNFHKKYWELAVLKISFIFASSSWKSVKVS